MKAINEYKKIGYTQAFKALTIGLIIAYLIMASLAGPFWIFKFDYAPTIIFAVFIIYLAGYFIGGLVAIWIKNLNHLAIIFGILGGFLIVWLATFFGSLLDILMKAYQIMVKIANLSTTIFLCQLLQLQFLAFFQLLL
jgi:hypothetical protein